MTDSKVVKWSSLRLGILTFSFCMLNLSVKGDITIWKLGHEISYPAPVPLYQGVAWFSLALTTLLVVAAFCEPVYEMLRLKDILDDAEPCEQPPIAVAVARFSLPWIVFVVFICGWTGFLSKITPQSVAFDVVFWSGLILLILCTVALGPHIGQASFPKKRQDSRKGGPPANPPAPC
jgi:hypothetical protein